MMSCNLINDIPEGIAKELRDVFGTNDTAFESHVVEYMSEEFQKYLSDNLETTDDSKKVVEVLDDVKDGIATKANGKTNMRVMERVTDNIVRVLMK